MPRAIRAVVMSSPTRNSARLHAYVSTDKAEQVGDRFVATSGINGAIPEHVEAQMRDNRKRWRKDGTRVARVQYGVDEHGRPRFKDITEGAYVHAYHVIQSFARDGDGALDPTDPEAWEEAHRLGRELARTVAGGSRLATVWTQVDGRTGCIHNHLVIDSVDRVSGRSFASSNVKHRVLAATHDAMLAEQGYVQRNEVKGTALERREKSEERGLLAHQQWEAAGRFGEPEPFSVAVLKDRIKDALEDRSFTDFEGFADALAARDVEVQQRGEKGRGLSYTMLRLRPDWDDYLDPSTSDRRRASTLGRAFMLDSVEAAIQRNLEAQQTQHAQATRAPLATAPGSPAGTRSAPAAEVDEDRYDQPRRGRRVVEEKPVEQVTEQPKKSLAELLAEKRARDLAQQGQTHVPDAMLEDLDEAKDEPVATAPGSPAGTRSAPAADVEHEAQEGSARSAPAATGGPHATAPGAPTEGAYVSRLRGLKAGRARQQETIARLADLDEWAHERLADGGRLDETRLRGLGQETLDRYGEYLDAGFVEQLELREAKKVRAKDLYELGTDAGRGRARQLRDQIAAGAYDMPQEVQATPRRGLTARERLLAELATEPTAAPQVEDELSL